MVFRTCYLVLSATVLLACTGCPRSGSDDDDDNDAVVNDDDSSVDDDDAADDDDDDAADDDDSVDDDDSGDDDDASGQLIVTMPGGQPHNFGGVAPGDTVSTSLALIATGTTPLNVTIWPSASTFWVTSSELVLDPGLAASVGVNFVPSGQVPYSGTVSIFHDGSNASPIEFDIVGVGQVSTETNCVDGLDNDADTLADCDDSDCQSESTCRELDCADLVDDDGDGAVDCDDPDCITDLACSLGDTCCGPEGTGSGDGECMDQTAGLCVCVLNPFCCDGWDSTCQAQYVDNCGAAYCGPF